MCGSRVCNFSFLLFLTCLSAGRVSGQGRPGQEVVTFLPQGDILYEISTVYTNQNTKAIITVVANEMIKWSVRDSTVSTVGCQILIPLPVHDWLLVRCRHKNVWFSPWPVLLSPLPSPIVRCQVWPEAPGSPCISLSLTPQLLCWPRGPEPWENEQIRAYTRPTLPQPTISAETSAVARNWMKL